jgi:hypothetical protein
MLRGQPKLSSAPNVAEPQVRPKPSTLLGPTPGLQVQGDRAGSCRALDHGQAMSATGRISPSASRQEADIAERGPAMSVEREAPVAKTRLRRASWLRASAGGTRSAMPSGAVHPQVPTIICVIGVILIAVSLATGRAPNFWKGGWRSPLNPPPAPDRTENAPLYWFSLAMMGVITGVAFCVAVWAWFST